MASRERKPNRKPRRPASTPDEEEEQLVASAYDLVRQRMDDGTATSQETTHFLKIGSRRGRLEEERLNNENQLLKARVAQIEQAERVEQMYRDALNAMRSYAGQDPLEDDYYDQD